MKSRIDYKIEIEPDDSEGDPWKMVVFYDTKTGEEINFRRICPALTAPTDRQIKNAVWSLANSLYHNPHYTAYRESLYSFVYPYGESGQAAIAFLILLVVAVVFLFVAYGAVETLVQQSSGQSLADILTIFPR